MHLNPIERAPQELHMFEQPYISRPFYGAWSTGCPHSQTPAHLVIFSLHKEHVIPSMGDTGPTAAVGS